jgi:hypothetical protein
MDMKDIKLEGIEDDFKRHLENILEIRMILQLLFDTGAGAICRPNPRLFHKSGEIRAELKRVIEGEVEYPVPAKTVRQNLSFLVEGCVVKKYTGDDCVVGDTKETVYSLSPEGADIYRLIALSALKVFVDAGISPSKVQSKVGGVLQDDQKPISKLKVLLSLYDQETIHSQQDKYERRIAEGKFGPLERRIKDIMGITGIPYKTVEWNLTKMKKDRLIVMTYGEQRFKIVGDVAEYFTALEGQRGKVTSKLFSAAQEGELAKDGRFEEFTIRDLCDAYCDGNYFDSVRGSAEKMEEKGVLKSLNHLTMNNPVELTSGGREVVEGFMIPFYRFVRRIRGNDGRARFQNHADFFQENKWGFKNYIVKMVKSYLANTSSHFRRKVTTS